MKDKQIEALKLALEALEIGHEYAVETAEHFHIEMAGYKQHRHDAMDAEVKQIADAITAIRKALAEQQAQQECNHCGGTGDVSGEYPGVACPDCSGSGVQVKPEFFTHSVEQPYDWSEWVCPDPKGYLMKCCDCGLVHEAEFGVVRYKSETEREDCNMVDDPNLQAVFRMRRSEQWSPEDTAHRAGGLPMEQPAQQQEPVAWRHDMGEENGGWEYFEEASCPECQPLYTSPPASKPWVGLSTDEIYDMYNEPRSDAEMVEFARAIETKLKEKNA